MRIRASLALLCALTGAVVAAPPRRPAAIGEQRYEGPRLGFVVPAGSTVKEATDIIADHAVDVTFPAALDLPQTSVRILLSNNKVLDLDVEGVATAWRDARVRNRGSWGVKKKGEDRVEIAHVGARRFIRLVDQMGSMLGNSVQLMLCGSVSARLVCGVATTAPDRLKTVEALLVRSLETVVVKKKS